MKKYFKILFSTELENPNEFLDKYGPSKLNQDEINNTNRFATNRKMKTVVKNIPKL